MVNIRIIRRKSFICWTSIIHMTSSASRIINILHIYIYILINQLWLQQPGYPIMCECRYFYSFVYKRTISLWGAGLSHKACLTPPVFIEVLLSSHENERSCVTFIEFASFHDFCIWFCNCLDSVVFVGFHVISLFGNHWSISLFMNIFGLRYYLSFPLYS